MKTKELLKIIKNKFKVSFYRLERFFNINHTKFFRYYSGKVEARFDEITKWLNKLNLCIINDRLYLIYDRTPMKESIDQLSSSFLVTHLNSVMNREQWKKQDKIIEETEGHKIFWNK